jgi:hypothetical protein
MSLQLIYAATAKAKETLEANVPAAPAGTRLVTHSSWDTAKTLKVDSSPPVRLWAAAQVALAAGTKTLDLTALLGTNELITDGTGLRVQVLRLRNPSTNANPISIAKGAANGYDGLGADFKVTLAPGAEHLILTNDAGSDISGTNKNLDMVGTGVQALDVGIALG